MKKALIVNDSRFESMILKDLLETLAYEVELANEFDALVEVENYGPDLIVVNYIMEEISGDRLIQLIKAGDPSMVCLLSSSSQLNREMIVSNGADGILRTPVSLFTLKDLLRRVYEGHPSSQPSEKKLHRTCHHCQGDLSAFSEQILFCPFCGEAID